MKHLMVVAALMVSVAACGNIAEPLNNVANKPTPTSTTTHQQQPRDLHGLQLSAVGGRIDGDIGFFTGVHESAPDTDFYDDGSYVELTLQSNRSDGSWGFASLSLNGDIADMPEGEPQVTENDGENGVVGCASSIDGDQYYDMPADEISVEVEPAPDDAQVPDGEEAVAQLAFIAHWDDYGPTMPEQTVKGRVILTAPLQ